LSGRDLAAARPRLGARRTEPISARLLELVSRWALLGVLGLIVLGFSLWERDTFPTAGNLKDIVNSQPPAVFIAFAAMLTLVVGEFDISLGANLGMAQYMVLALITKSDLSWEEAIAVTLAAGLGIGLFNAFLVVGLGLNSFIATIGVATVLAGLLEWYSGGGAPIFGGAPDEFLRLAQHRVSDYQLPVFYGLGAALLLWVLLEYTVFGRDLRATGSNRQAAFLSGIPTRRSLVFAFALAGLLASFAGILATARIGAADASSGPNYLLPAFAAAFLGATAIRPGFFNVWGTVIAIFVVAVGITGLQLKGVASWVTPVFNGVVLLIAVVVSNLAARRQASGRRQAASLEPDDPEQPAVPSSVPRKEEDE
jgi:ribose transport system permease protein